MKKCSCGHSEKMHSLENGKTVCSENACALWDECSLVIPDIDLLVWDLETTGFVAPEAKILEIGAFLVTGDTVEHKHWVLNNHCEIPEKIVEITGITQEIIDKEGRDPVECLKEFLPLFKRAKKNITHNGIRFDIPFLLNSGEALFEWTPKQKAAATELIRSRTFDTAVHCKAEKLGNCPDTGEPYLDFADRIMEIRAFGVKYSLGLMCEEKKIDTSNIAFHRALGDVAMTLELYKTIDHKFYLS